MKTKEVPFSWIQRWGHRLDVEPYLGGAIEARVLLEKADYRKEPLLSLTSGHNGGIYNGPMFRRNYVESPEYGVPFLTSSPMLRADLSELGLLRRKDAESPKLAFLMLTRGTTLISCSGTIGRTVYTRPDMEGMWASQDVLKVVPNPRKVPPGFLFAFLSSKFGVPMVTSGTYGAIIQHIEPAHIADLPVPRLGDRVEVEAHALVEKAAIERTQAVELLKDAQQRVVDVLGSLRPQGGNDRLWTSVKSSNIRDRCDAFYYSEKCLKARRAFDIAPNCDTKPIGAVADVFIPGIFKRVYAEDPQYGVPYITGADVFQIAPTTTQYLQKKVAQAYGLVVDLGMILIQEAGQLGGLIGRSVAVGHYLDGFAVSNNMARVTAHERDDMGYLFSVLSSEAGVTLISREAAGSSIPHIDAGRIKRIMIPWAAEKVRRKIGALVVRARDLRDNACEYENEARELVEQAIEEAT